MNGAPVPRTQKTNPFRIHGVVSEQFFTDRAPEIDRILRTLGEPSAKLLIYGPRRIGKTSALVRAIARHEADGGVAFLADMSTSSTLIDVANRILEAAGRALGRRWRDSISDFVERIGLTITLTPDPGTGVILPSLDVRLRSASLDEQRGSLSKTLDSIDALAKSRQTPIGIVLDEFQEIRRFGGDAAEWHLRGVMQHHQHVSYILAGSQAHIIERMLDRGRAFYGLADQLQFGPIDGAHLSAWIDDRMTNGGVTATGVGSVIVAKAGSRTRDIVQVARQCFDNCKTAGRAAETDVVPAFDDVVAEQEALLHSIWSGLTAQQQNVLRAIAANLEGLTTKASAKRFGLTSSGTASNAASAMIEAGHLVKSPSKTGYSFENPFFCRWVERETMGDLGAPAPTVA
jgi:Cdc6-like AAA superfamily ATPase